MLKGFDDYEQTAGDKLRGARASIGLDLAEVSAKLRISDKLLLEIEEGRFSGDSPAYLMNNIARDYAEFLNMDPIEIRALYWKEVADRTSSSVELDVFPDNENVERPSLVRRVMSRLGF